MHYAYMHHALFSFVQDWIKALVGRDHGLTKRAANHLALHVRKKVNKTEMVRLAAYTATEMVSPSLSIPLHCPASCMHGCVHACMLVCVCVCDLCVFL